MTVFNLAHHEDPSFHVQWAATRDAALYVNVENPMAEVDDPLRRLVRWAVAKHAVSAGAPLQIAHDIAAGLSRDVANAGLPK